MARGISSGLTDDEPDADAYLQWCSQTPTAKQREFLEVTAFEAMYGGQAGGGKSSALLMGALQHVHVPGYAALIMRQTYSDLALAGAIMDRSHEWLGGTDARWDGTTYTWRFPSGATVSFGYLRHNRDRFRYQGAEFQYMAFDELTQFRELDYRYLISRVRRARSVDAPLRVRSGTNPGGVGHDWVYERFVNEETRGDRVFIPARLEDNPHLDAEEYAHSLSRLLPHERRQLRHGDWLSREPGEFFQREWWGTARVDAPAEFDAIGRAWDEAATKSGGDWTVGAKVGVKDGVWWILDVVRAQTTSQGVDALMDQCAAIDGWQVPILLQQDPGSAGKARVEAHKRRLVGHDVRSDPPTGSKVVRAAPLASAAEAGNVRLHAGPWIEEFLYEADAFPGGAHDDQIDAVSWAMLMLSRSTGIKRAPMPPASAMMGGISVGGDRGGRYAPGEGAGRWSPRR